MSNHGRQHYFGSYGLIRGYGPLHKTLKEADDSVFEDGRVQRKKHGGSTDRNAVVVSADNGHCWWLDSDDFRDDGADIRDEELVPVRTPNGSQARYADDVLRKCEALWEGPRELAGFG